MKETNNKIYNFIFFLSISLYLLGRFLEYTVWDEDYSVIFVALKNVSYLFLAITLLIAIITLFFKDGKKLQLNRAYLIGVIIFFFYYFVKYDINSAFVCFGFSTSATLVKRKTLFNYLYYYLIFLLLIGMLGGIGIMNTTIRDWGNTGVRYAFAFEYPYTMQLLWMSVVSCRLLYKEKEESIQKVIANLIITTILHLIGDVRGAFFSTIFLIVYDYFLKTKYKNRILTDKRLKYINKLSYVFFFFFVLINGLCIIYAIATSTFLIDFDKLLTGRISMGARYFIGLSGAKIPIMPISRDADFRAWALSSWLDSEYSNWLFCYGALFSVVMLIVLFVVLKKVIHLNDWHLLAVLVSIALNACIDPCILSILYNPAILCCVPILMSKPLEKAHYGFE